MKLKVAFSTSISAMDYNCIRWSKSLTVCLSTGMQKWNGKSSWTDLGTIHSMVFSNGLRIKAITHLYTLKNQLKLRLEVIFFFFFFFFWHYPLCCINKKIYKIKNKNLLNCPNAELYFPQTFTSIVNSWPTR